MRNLVYRAALSYVKEFGFSVIPVSTTGNKKPLVPWEKYQTDLPTEKELATWFNGPSPSNIAIVTGEVSGMCAVDIDSFTPEVEAYGLRDVVTPSVITPRFGNHNYHSLPDFRVSNNQKKIAGVDFRGNGGYIVAPPSTNMDGSTYSWRIPIGTVPLAPVPEAYLALLQEEPVKELAEMFTSGRRDADLFHVANCLAKGGMPMAECMHIVMQLGELCEPRFPRAEVIAKVRSAYKRNKAIDVNKEVREWVGVQTGMFDIGNIYRDLALDSREDKKNVSYTLSRMVGEGLIQRENKAGRYRIVEDDCSTIQWWEADGKPLDIELPLGLSDLVNIHKKNIIVVSGYSNSGKGHPDGTKILSPSGWRNVEELCVGDEIYAHDGTVTTVTGVFPRGPQQCFEWTFNDRTSITTDFEHLWAVRAPYNRVKTSGRGKKNERYGDYEVIESYKILSRIGGFGDFPKAMRFSIPTNAPVEFGVTDIPIDPYVMGLLLGDGSLSKDSVYIHTADQEIIDSLSREIESIRVKKDRRSLCYSVTLYGLKSAVSRLGLSGHRSWEKFIPKPYLFNSVENRLAVLQGLLDTDGDISENGMSISFTTVSPQLCEDVTFLVRSLGGKAVVSARNTHYRHNGEYRRGRLSYRIHITMKPFCPFRLERKASRYIRTKKSEDKKMVRVTNAGIQNTTCISIAHESGLYIAENFTVTHNTAFMLDFVRMNMDRHKVHYFNSEMGSDELKRRLQKFKNVRKEDWRKFIAYERDSNFADVIRPNEVNVIDFLEVNEEFWKVGVFIKDIHDKLDEGIAVIAIQKKAGTALGLGAEFGLHKPRLYINMEKGCARIMKAKNWKHENRNPNGLYRLYDLKDGYEFQYLTDWKR